MIVGTNRKEIKINSTDGHIKKSQLSQLSISKSFDRFIYQSINGRNHQQKGTDYKKKETHHQDRTKEYTGRTDASKGQVGT